MNTNIEFFVQNEECPLINALFLSTGEMYVLESLMGAQPIIRVLCKSTTKSYFEYNDDEYVTSFDVHKKVESEKFIVSIGEGGFGGDGIVYLISKETGKLLWFLFLDNSNPFNTVKIENSSVIVGSTKNISFNIPITKPESISLL